MNQNQTYSNSCLKEIPSMVFQALQEKPRRTKHIHIWRYETLLDVLRGLSYSRGHTVRNWDDCA